jgi:DNA-binding NarL/FixJ family response regulator
MSMYDDAAYVGCALSLGVHGYVTKSASSSELIEAIHAVMTGERYLSAPHSNASIDKYMESAKSVKFDVYKTLTKRERQVCDLILEGFSTRQIAQAIGNRSERTVETHRSHIKKKYGAKTQAEMVRLILQSRGRYGES